MNNKGIKGRGALTNPDSRFSRVCHQRDEAPAERPLTQVIEETVSTLINRNQSPDLPFRQSINPYRGCEHGCIYCYARPSHAYLGLSPGLDFETRLTAKINADSALRQTLVSPNYRCAPISLGANTDPYLSRPA